MIRPEANVATSSGILKKFFVVTLCSILYGIIIWFAQTSPSAIKATKEQRALDTVLKLDASTSLAVVRVLQGLLATLSFSDLWASFESFQWHLTNRPEGLGYVSALALSPITTLPGTLRILGSKPADLKSRLWALLKLSLIGALWLSTIILFVRTSTVTVYDTATTYNVTAGVGLFNGSLVAPFIENLHKTAPGYPFETMPYSYYMLSSNLVANPLYSTWSDPVQCDHQAGECDSYVLSGGVVMSTPWIPTGYANHPLVKIEETPVLQLDFLRGNGTTNFRDTDCLYFGQRKVLMGIRFCLRRHELDSRSLVIGLYTCPKGTDGGNCVTSNPTANITTSLSIYSRRATVVAAKYNMSVLAVTDLTEPVQAEPIDLSAYKSALAWLLNYTAANIPPPTSIAQHFWGSTDRLLEPDAQVVLLQIFQSLLALPFWLFNANSLGNPDLQQKETAAIVAPYTKLLFDQTMLVVFAFLQGVVLVFVWVTLAWTRSKTKDQLPLSSYALFDSNFKSWTDIDASDPRVLGAANSDVLEIATKARAYAKRVQAGQSTPRGVEGDGGPRPLQKGDDPE